MLVLTDLVDRDLDSLDCLARTRFVKPRLTEKQRELVSWLAGVPLAATPRFGLAGAGGSTDPGPWGAIVLAGDAPGSQYDALLATARRRGPPPAPVAALALSGRGFHGNRGRPWLAARGNLHLSCFLPVDLPAARCAPAVPAIPAVAVCEVVAALAPTLQPRLKWVNDVLLDGAKVAGVLAAAQSRGPRITGLGYGVGLNLAVVPDVAPTLFVPRVTSLREQGADVALGPAAAALLRRLDQHVADLARGGPGAAVAAYRSLCGDIGRRVAVYAEGVPDTADREALPDPVARGRVRALDEQLGLVIDGAPAPLTGGRLHHLDSGH